MARQTYELFVDGTKMTSGLSLRETMLMAARLGAEGNFNWTISIQGGSHNGNIVVEGLPQNASKKGAQ